MKKITAIVSLLIVAISVPGCRQKLFDYRNKYLGDYHITYHYNYWEMGGITKDTTITYDGEVRYGDKGEIKMDWYDGSEYTFTISKKGALSKCSNSIGTMDKHRFELTFTDDVCGTGPMGANHTVTLNGDKK